MFRAVLDGSFKKSLAFSLNTPHTDIGDSLGLCMGSGLAATHGHEAPNPSTDEALGAAGQVMGEGCGSFRLSARNSVSACVITFICSSDS